MDNKITAGPNKTGIQTAFHQGKEQTKVAEETKPDIPGSDAELAQARTEFTKESTSIGSVSTATTLKGFAMNVVEKMKGDNPALFIDKLGERMAFERTGARLYDALIAKVQALETPVGTLELLIRFRDEEVSHFHTVVEALEALGADPTSQTPSADVVGVSASGLLNVITDPRTTLAQALNALLSAELTDNAGWELLIELAKEMGHLTLVENFHKALQEEQLHLETIQCWLKKELLKEAA